MPAAGVMVLALIMYSMLMWLMETVDSSTLHKK